MIDNNLVLDFLSEFVSEERRNRIEEVLAERTRYISILLEDIYQSQNASAVLRTCECFGIQNVHVVENYNIYNINPMVLKGSDKWLSIRKFNGSANNSIDAVNELKSEGYRIVATSLQEESAGLYEFDLLKGKCVIVFGNEHQGVSKSILQHADEHLKIPMTGFTQSLNISVSAGIVLSHLIYRLKQTDIRWQLTSSEKEELRLKWFKNSVKNPEMLIKRLTEENIHPK
ncbi:MAG: RNA methyltransferase [Bacteroidales bacterium]|jgi:tRNA (guanosine-2'-O-)-methyltransferase|nr:RNA methyltransferase [Bacteroidales bacterium]